MNARHPRKVSVIVPTIGRPELRRALDSARSQDTDADVEVVVVVDAASADERLASALEEADVVRFTGGGKGGGTARNVGIEAADGDLVAFLDDDDEWFPTKLSRQLDVLTSARHPDRTVIGSRNVHVDPDRQKTSRPVPAQVKTPGQRVDEYLFRRRRPTAGRASIYTSTLLCPRGLALEVPWNPALRRHQDWDWLIRVSRVPDVEILQAPEPLVRVQTGSAHSISARSDWHSSLRWADATIAEDPAIYADFVAAQPLRYALGARSWEGTSKIVRRLWSNRTLPAIGPLMIGLGGVLPRRTIERVMLR